MNGLQAFNDFITIISFLVNVMFTFPLVIKAYTFLTDKRYLKKILGFNNKSVLVSHSTFTFSTEKGHVHDYITYESLKSMGSCYS